MPRLAVLLFALLAVAVWAEEARRPSFEVADSDGDSRVSFAEFRLALLAHLDKRAAQKSGRAVPAERRERAARWLFDHLDTNDDQALDAAEWRAGLDQGAKARRERAS